ncbi:MAG: RNA 2',3'-cyclic phosphodiesterase [Oscillospiraceae bacterium]|nr:RNA 2',3'-cyclic phosphodiesterase [Oscillospiraceae bacterium]
MRLFVAVRLSDEMREALLSAQNALFDRGVRGNFTPEENLHLTLAFIGDYPDAGPVLDTLEKVAFRPFALTLEGLGCFGDLWWAGLRGSAPLEALARRVRRALAEAEIPFDRKRFSPHVTLIRRAAGKLPGTELPPASMTVGSFSLMRSDRGRHGMIYTELGTRKAEPAAE